MFAFRGGLFVDFFLDFFGPFSLEKRTGKNPPKNPRFSSDLFEQNPLREISALREGAHKKKGSSFFGGLRPLFWYQECFGDIEIVRSVFFVGIEIFFCFRD